MSVLVAGGGLAGAAAAVALAQGGADVTVVERAAGPVDKICGEFVSGEAVAALRGLGVDVAALGGAAIHSVRLVRGAKVVTAGLPFVGVGLSRRVLDEALLRRAEGCGARVLRGRAVRGVEGTALDVEGVGVLRGRALLLATGKHELRGAKRAAAAGNGLVGLKMYFRLGVEAQAGLAGHVELVMFPGGYAGLQMVDGARANFCLLVEKARLRLCGGWEGLLGWLCAQSAHLAGRLAGAVGLLAAPLSIARVPYGFVHRGAGPEGVYRLGDQAGVIQSFTGDGMAIALHSAGLAARAVLRGETAAVYHRRLAGDVAGQIWRAGAIYWVANRKVAQPVMMGVAGVWPGLLGVAARVTRVEGQAAAGAMAEGFGSGLLRPAAPDSQ